MKAKKLFIALLTIVLAAGIAHAVEKAAKELSNTRDAQVELRITTDPKTFPMGTKEDGIGRLTDVMFRRDVAQAVWQEIIDTSDWDGFVKVRIKEPPLEIGELQTVQVCLTVSLKESQRPAAKEFLEAYIEKLKVAMKKENDFGRNLFGNKLEQYYNRAQQAENHLESLLSRQNNLAGGKGPLDKESVRQRILEHDREEFEIGMQMTVLANRAEALSSEIARLEAKSKRIAEQDPVIRQMKDNLEKYKSDLESIMVQIKNLSEKGVNPSDDMKASLSELKEKINSAEVNLAQRKQAVQEIIKQELKILNKKLREMTTNMQGAHAKQQILSGYGPGSLSDSVEYEMLEVKIAAAKENLRRALVEKDEFRMQIDLLQQPVVSYDKIISSEMPPKPKED